ncbi:MAG: rod shape-determining protein MreC [Bacilli bacterium]|nr:rod shape-determining protein MreC [Bacilli bacterium]
MIKIMKRKNKINKILVVFIIIIGIISINYSLRIDRNVNQIENSIKSITSSLKKILINDDLKDYENIVFSKTNKLYKEELNELKELLDLKKVYPNYKIINSTVTTRNKTYFLNTLEIDKGEKDGLRNNMAVVTTKGLIGKISKVYKNSSEVKLLSKSSNKYKTSIIIRSKENDYIGIIEDVKDNLIIVKNIDKSSNIKKGDEIITSGMEKEIPKGIYIGKVEHIENEKYSLSKKIYIKSEINFNSIHYVSVLGENNE